MPYFVYILRSQSTGKTYVGQTSDLERRLAQHNDPGCVLTAYTKKNAGPWVVIHSEEYATRSEAMRREKELKSGKGREWITSMFPARREPAALNTREPVSAQSSLEMSCAKGRVARDGRYLVPWRRKTTFSERGRAPGEISTYHAVLTRKAVATMPAVEQETP